MTAILLALVGVSAGLLGALMGVGGGVIIVPALTELFGVPFRHAVGASLVVIIMSSSASSATFVARGTTDIRAGVLLGLATIGGALVGSAVAGVAPVKALRILFAAVTLYSAVMLWRRRHGANESSAAESQEVRGWGPGLGAGGAAGVLSGLLGVGGGVFMMPVMTLVMRIPFKVAAATSNFLIAATAAAGAYVYWDRGEVDALLAAPVVVGVFLGARLGATLLPRIPAQRLQGVFAGFLVFVGGRMIWSVFGGGR